MPEIIFRRYEAVLTKAVNAFPSTTSFACHPERNLNTDIARCRDAKLYLSRNPHITTTVDVERFQSIKSLLKVYTNPSDPTQFLLGSQTSSRQDALPATVTKFALSVNTVTLQQLDAILLLVNHSIITDPCLIRTPDEATVRHCKDALVGLVNVEAKITPNKQLIIL